MLILHIYIIIQDFLVFSKWMDSSNFLHIIIIIILNLLKVGRVKCCNEKWWSEKIQMCMADEGKSVA